MSARIIVVVSSALSFPPGTDCDPCLYDTFVKSRPDSMEVKAIETVCRLCKEYGCVFTRLVNHARPRGGGGGFEGSNEPPLFNRICFNCNLFSEFIT